MLVWHAHMLNPQCYLEDCIRYGRRELWHRGMPWNLINAAIDVHFNYQVTNECKRSWKARTGKEWDNLSDPETKKLDCPTCTKTLRIPWTTCGLSHSDILAGSGYGDNNFLKICSLCGTHVDHGLLQAKHFWKDFQALLADGYPMPGTILATATGLPTQIPAGPQGNPFPQTFPNRLLRYLATQRSSSLLMRSSIGPSSMEEVRQAIEDAIAPINHFTLARIDGQQHRFRYYKLTSIAKIHVRKMMSRYWNNIHPFALDLASAVHRQSIFTDKMYQVSNAWAQDIPTAMIKAH